MSARLRRTSRVALLLVAAFLVGGASAEVAVRTHAAIERVRAEREIGAAGQLVVLQLQGADGDVIARPRVIAPAGKPTEVVLHEPGDPDAVRLAFRVEATREPSGEIALEYALYLPERAVAERGRVSLTPGVEQQVALAHGTLVASWLAVPVPSAAFDALMEAEAQRRSPGKTS
ncbi:MAG TPA: hypothetical protein VFL83_08575 [Anaeromyxobacter sp.]|nr:hypothetical protein [Anaeromyxobacter sp.]